MHPDTKAMADEVLSTPPVTRPFELPVPRSSEGYDSDQERAAAHAYLSQLLRAHAPQCEAADTLLGVVTQIDNLLTGLRGQSEEEATP